MTFLVSKSNLTCIHHLLGDAGLLEEDKYLAEVNLEGLETTLGE
jgi:hypothetical protein